MNLSPIVLFVYNRPWHTKQTVEALQHCELSQESELYIFADGPKTNATEECRENIKAVREYICNIKGFQSIHIEEAPVNKGLANSVISGVSKVIEKREKVIVVEDDIVAHPFFLRFMNEMLEFYEHRQKIFAISATMEYFQIPVKYKKDVFLTYRFGSWGWATWRNRWETINWDITTYPVFVKETSAKIKRFNRGGDNLWPMLQAQRNGEINSWAIRLGYNMSVQNRFCLRPIWSFVNNIGMDSSGVHCGNDPITLLPQYNRPLYDLRMDNCIKPNRQVNANIQKNFRIDKKNRHCFKRIIKRLLSKMNKKDESIL